MRHSRLLGIWLLLLTGSAAAQLPDNGLDLRLEEWPGMRPEVMRPMVVRVRPSGEVTREGDSPLGPAYVDPAVRARLRSLLTDEGFFDLPRQPEKCPVDGGFNKIVATIGRRHHEVIFCGVHTDKRAVRSLIRIWYPALSSLSDPGSVQVPKAYRSFVKQGQ